MSQATQPGSVGFSSSPRFVEHQTGPYHPERPDRIRAIYRAVTTAGLIESPDPFPDFSIDLGPLHASGVRLTELGPPTPADEQWLRLVHSQNYIDRIRQACEEDGVLDQGDTPVHPGSFEIALLSAGSLLNCCDAVMSDRVKRAFSAGRPPGHHAEPERPMGFCLFANVAIAAKYLQSRYGLGHVAIVDFDVHHGNGTQAAFEDDPTVLFISLHQDPRTCYPGSGFDFEVGAGPGRGLTLNLPFDPGSDDDGYLRVMEQRVIPKLDNFGPELLLISAGFDAHRDDPLAQINLSEEGFEQLTRMLVGAAERHCKGRIVSALEGGYNLRALARSVVRHLVALDGQ